MKRRRRFDPTAIPRDEWGLYIKLKDRYLDRKTPKKNYVWLKTKCPNCGSEIEKLLTYLQTSTPRLVSEYTLCHRCRYEKLRRDGKVVEQKSGGSR